MSSLRTTITIILFTCLSAKGQNLLSTEGLNYGHWIDTIAVDNQKIIHSGEYKIVPLSFFNIIRNGPVVLELKYKNGKTSILHDKVINNKISVTNGLWQRRDTTGRLLSEDYSENGIRMWYKDYDSTGKLTEYWIADYERNTDSLLRYADNGLFCIDYHTGGNYKNAKHIYYPGKSLIISNAEPTMSSNFLKKSTDTFLLKLSSKEQILINNIASESDNFHFFDKLLKPIKFPLNIIPGKYVVINLIYKPKPYSFKEAEVISLTTNDSTDNNYKLKITTFAYHFDYSEVEKIKHLTLSISKDKFLVIPRLGTATSATFTGLKGETTVMQINENSNKIDLSQFKPGKYNLSILSCNAYGNMVVNLRE